MKAPKYRPLDEILATPTVRILRALQRFDSAAMGDLLLALGIMDGKGVEANGIAVTLGRLVRKGYVGAVGIKNERLYSIRPTGAQLLSVKTAVVDEVAKKRRNRPGTRKSTWTAAKAKAQYYSRKSKRRCVSCDAGMPEGDDRAKCVECRERQSDTDKRIYYKMSGRRRRLLWRERYKRRSEKVRATRKARYIRHKLEGLCVQCSRPAGEHYLCDVHKPIELERKRQYMAGQRARRIRIGICIHCPSKAAEGRQQCEPCLAKHSAAQARIRRRALARAA